MMTAQEVQTETRPEMTANLFDLLTRSSNDPNKVAIETASGERTTYAGLIAETGRMANVLKDLGVGPGDRVAAQVEKSVAAIVLYLATVRAGGVFLPLNTGYTPAEVEYFLGDAEPAVFVCDPSRLASLEPVAAKAGARTVTLDANGAGSLTEAAASAPEAFETVARTQDDLAALLYTSGTTGRSKGAMLSHGNLASNAAALRDTWRYTADDVLIHALPIFHTHGLFVATNITLLSGASMLFLPRFDPEKVFALMPRATVLMGVPTFYVRLLEDDRLTAQATKHMRLFVSGSAPLLAETHREWQARTNHAILERYGMTETNMNASNPYEGARVAGTVGMPLPGVEIIVTDPETGAELPQGEIGMIEVRGPNVFKGYWRMPEKTAAELRDNGFFISGDLGRIDDKGYLHIVGRGKDLIITGGYNVYPKEIEAEIDEIPGVVESAVVGLPHRDFGEGVTAVVVTNGKTEITETDVIKALEGRLAKFKLPKRVIFADDLPRNTMGKVQKNLLRATYDDLYRQ
jgi:malonyl-CoA/methylmalonyl-CoA synthetase